jgi:hypothetical protein
MQACAGGSGVEGLPRASGAQTGGFAAAGAGFLLAVLWFDLMFDV